MRFCFNLKVCSFHYKLNDFFQSLWCRADPTRTVDCSHVWYLDSWRCFVFIGLTHLSTSWLQRMHHSLMTGSDRNSKHVPCHFFLSLSFDILRINRMGLEAEARLDVLTILRGGLIKMNQSNIKMTERYVLKTTVFWIFSHYTNESAAPKKSIIEIQYFAVLRGGRDYDVAILCSIHTTDNRLFTIFTNSKNLMNTLYLSLW